VAQDGSASGGVAPPRSLEPRKMRRPPALLALLLALAVFGSARGDDEADADDDADLDLEDLEDDVALGAGEGEAEGEEFDLGMPPEDQLKRMQACYVHMMNRIQHRRDQLEAAIQELVQQRSGEVSNDQAANSIVVSWMMQCYMNIDGSSMKEAIHGKAPSPELEQQLFAPRSDQPKQASQRQWKLLSDVVAEGQKEALANEKRQQQQQQQQQQKSSTGRSGEAPAPQPPAYTGGGPLLSGLSGQSQAIYVLVVFGVIFGLGAIGVMRLMRSEQESRNRLSKKQEKSEKRASRKKQ